MKVIAEKSIITVTIDCKVKGRLVNRVLLLTVEVRTVFLVTFQFLPLIVVRFTPFLHSLTLIHSLTFVHWLLTYYQVEEEG